MSADDICVVELSSFQLISMRKSPDVAVITNVAPNHLDVHKDMDEYVEAKANVFNFHKEGNKLVLNADNDHQGTCDFHDRKVYMLSCSYIHLP